MNLDERLQKDLSPDIYCLVHNKIINLEQQAKKQKEVIDKAIDKLYSIPIETTRQEVIDIARETVHILKEVSE